jgi:hypothetical protein
MEISYSFAMVRAVFQYTCPCWRNPDEHPENAKTPFPLDKNI